MLGIAWALTGDRRVKEMREGEYVDREESSPGCYFREESRWSSEMGRFLGREIKEDTDFTLKPRGNFFRRSGCRFPFIVTADLKSGKKRIFMENFVHIAAHMKENEEVIPRFHEMTKPERDFLRRVLWDIHNFEQELHEGYVRLIAALEPNAPRPNIQASRPMGLPPLRPRRKGSTTTV